MDFKKQAEGLLKQVLHEYRNRPEWNKKTLGEMVDFYLAKYNEEVKKQIEDELYKQLGSFYFINDNPQIAVTPVLLSDMLYKNAKDTAKLASKILYDGIKAKDTIGEIAKKLYEGYGFKDKEILDLADKNLPDYIRKAIFNPFKQERVMKQIEKLKTKPLRIAYKEIFRKLDEMNAEAIEKAMRTALEEKARYYANRIAKTETHRAFMSKRAKDMLEDDEVEFVKFEMSSAHKKTDICDFYANLDVGYGRGVIPKREMRATPLHPHCYCIYTPYYKKVKGKRKKWNTAVKETMNRFSEKEQREILGSYEKLMRFKAGEDIEKIFNSIRPKYPIKRYVDILEGKGYNSFIRKYEEAILKKFENFDVGSKENAIENFKSIWNNLKTYEKHIKKRKEMGHIKDEFDYLDKTLNCLANSKECLIAFYKEKDIWNRIRYFDNDEWIVIFSENGTLLTSHKKENTEVSFEEKHKKLGAKIKKGEISDGFKRFFEKLRDEFKIL